jgi:SAM-dependent methyltransferase
VSDRSSRWFWTLYALAYDAAWDGPLLERVGDVVRGHLLPGLPVVEVGAGTGLVTRGLVDNGYDVWSTEPAAAMARRHRVRVPEIEVEELALEDLVPTGSRHNVVAVNVLHFVGDAGVALAHLRQLAGRGGRVVVVTPRGATLGRAAEGVRQAGASPAIRARFVLLHLLLIPLFVAARPTAGLERVRGLAVAASARSDVLELFDVWVFAGAGADVPFPSHAPAAPTHDLTGHLAPGGAATSSLTTDGRHQEKGLKRWDSSTS